MITAVVILTAGAAVAQNGFGTATSVPSWSPPINYVGNLPKLSPDVLNHASTHPGWKHTPTTPAVAPPPAAPAVVPAGAPAVVPAAAPSLPFVPGTAPFVLPVVTPSIAPVASPSVVVPSVVAPSPGVGNNPAPTAATPIAPVAASNPPVQTDPGAIGAIGGLASSVPETARALLTTPTGRSVAVVFALMLAILAFLGVHGRLDRSQLKLGAERTARDLARFR